MKYLKIFESFNRTIDPSIKKGDYIKLINLKNTWTKSSPKPNDIGFVTHISYDGEINVRWFNGTNSPLVPGMDKYENISFDEYNKQVKIKNFNL